MKLKPVIWVGSSKKDLQNLPDEVRIMIGYALFFAQKGNQYPSAKVLKGFGSAGIIEIRESDEAGTYRAVYTIKMPEVIFVLHVFQKKSKHGIKTPKTDIDLVKNRLKQAEEMYKEKFKKNGVHEKE